MIVPNRRRIVWISGQSDPATCRLSASQSEFLESLELPDWEIVSLNFPFDETLDNESSQRSIVRASFHNGWQFAADSIGLRRKKITTALDSLLLETSELLIIAGSCGMQIILDGNIDRDDRVKIIALGPVGWRVPRCSNLLMQGDGDYISRFFYQRNVVRISGQRHLNYQSNANVIATANNWICNNISK